jgi:hypothetical protein
MSLAKKILYVLLGICRILVGMTIVYAGIQLIRREGLFAASDFGGSATGLFTIVIGMYCISLGVLSIFNINKKNQHFSLDE